MKKRILHFLLILISVFVSSSCSSQNQHCKICGEWRWEKNSEQRDFSIQISLKDGVLTGTHCYILDSGNKMDCSSGQEDMSFKVPYSETDSMQINIRSYYSGAQGVAQLKLKNEKLYWKLVKTPKEEYYLPKEAILIKDKR